MKMTPYFPAFRSKLAAWGRRAATQVKTISPSLLEHSLAHLFPPHMLSDEEEGANSRQRLFFMRRTFWSFLWQTLGAQRACRDVVLQVKAMLALETQARMSNHTGAYVTARHRLPLERLRAIFNHLVKRASDAAAGIDLCHGRRVMVVDATTVQLPDTPENQRRYPQSTRQKPGCGFPLMKISALFHLASGALEAVAQTSTQTHEIPLFLRLFSHLRRGDIWLGDALYGVFVMLAYSGRMGVDAIARVKRPRRLDFRKGRKLGPNERVVQWNKPQKKPGYLSERIWAVLPKTLDLRLIRVTLFREGFRPLRFYVVTTLLDDVKYPAESIASLYLRRWRLELCFRDLKTSLGMEALRTKTPAMAEKELLMFLIAHNMIRCLMAEASAIHDQPLDAISFMGAVAVARQYGHALAQARSRRVRKQLLAAMLETLAREILPFRPNRVEPRVVKRRPKPFPRMMISRAEFRALNVAKRSSSKIKHR